MGYNPQLHHRRSIRLKGYDYGQEGAYFITLCTQDRTHLFGDVKGGAMHLNTFGLVAYQEWLKTPDVRPNIVLDVFVIMPNHMHGILLITGPDTRTSTSSKGESHSPRSPTEQSPLDKGECDTPQQFKSPSNTIGAIVRGYKSAVTKKINELQPDGTKVTVWQRNYHEHIIRHERAYQNISDYIINNPLKWEADRFFR